MTDQPRDLARERPFSLWSFLRNVLMQGAAIEQDSVQGRFETYEHFSARMDEAAREREAELLASQSTEMEAVTAGARRTAELNVQVGQENQRLREELQRTREALRWSLKQACIESLSDLDCDLRVDPSALPLRDILAKALEGKS